MVLKVGRSSSTSSLPCCIPMLLVVVTCLPCKMGGTEGVKVAWVWVQVCLNPSIWVQCRSSSSKRTWAVVGGSGACRTCKTCSLKGGSLPPGLKWLAVKAGE